MSRSRGRAVALLALFSALAVTSWPGAAYADEAPPREVSVAPAGCVDLDIVETERLLRVELAVVAARVERPRAPSVTIACTNSSLHIEISDPKTNATRALDLPAPSRAPGRERTVALAASQLFLSSWLEMIVHEGPPPRAPEVKSDSSLSPVALAPRRSPRAHYEVALGIGASARDLARPVNSLKPELLVTGLAASTWLFGLRAFGEFGSVSRASGSIRTEAVSAGACGGLRLGSKIWGFETELALGLYVAHAKGIASGGDTLGTSANGAAAQFDLLAGPTISLPPVRVKLAAEGGFTTPAVVLRVAHEAPAELSGLSLGAVMLVGVELGS